MNNSAEFLAQEESMVTSNQIGQLFHQLQPFLESDPNLRLMLQLFSGEISLHTLQGLGKFNIELKGYYNQVTYEDKALGIHIELELPLNNPRFDSIKTMRIAELFEDGIVSNKVSFGFLSNRINYEGNFNSSAIPINLIVYRNQNGRDFTRAMYIRNIHDDLSTRIETVTRYTGEELEYSGSGVIGGSHVPTASPHIMIREKNSSRWAGADTIYENNKMVLRHDDTSNQPNALVKDSELKLRGDVVDLVDSDGRVIDNISFPLTFPPHELINSARDILKGIVSKSA